jgi:hypothetical protein
MNAMKKKFTLVFLIIFGLTLKMIAQSSGDSAMVLQKCIDLPVLQQHYPLGEDGCQKQIHIMLYPTNFPKDIKVSKFGKAVVFMKRPEIYDNRVEGFFLFKVFSISQNIANVTFDYYYDYLTDQKVVMVNLVLQKAGEVWEISDSKIGRR